MGAAGIVLGVTILHGLGAIKPRKHIAPPPPIAGLPYSASVAWALPPVLDQGNSNACVAFATDEALWTERKLRGEALPYAMPSPFFTYWYNTYGRNVGTSLDGEAQAAEQHGMIPWSWLPSFGPAPSQYAVNNAAGYGGTYHYIFSGYPGWAGLNAVEAEIAAGQPVVLLMRVNQSFYDAAGAVTDNSGNFIGNHAVMAYSYGGSAVTIRNSWGTGWGAGGNVTLTPGAFLNTVIAAVVVEPGNVTWPQSRPLPTPHPVVRPRPTATPVRPHKAPRRVLIGVVTTDMALRPRPVLRASHILTLRRGRRVVVEHQQTPHWRRICVAKGPCGWLLKSRLRVLKP
jgi:hypothetical protein